VELTPKQEAEVLQIMAEMNCPRGFPCSKSAFEKLKPVLVYHGANIIRCQHEERLNCRYGYDCNGIVSCKCPMRRYAALKLGR